MRLGDGWDWSYLVHWPFFWEAILSHMEGHSGNHHVTFHLEAFLKGLKMSSSGASPYTSLRRWRCVRKGSLTRAHVCQAFYQGFTNICLIHIQILPGEAYSHFTHEETEETLKRHGLTLRGYLALLRSM